MIRRLYDILKSNIEYQINKRNPSVKNDQYSSENNESWYREESSSSQSKNNETRSTKEQQLVDDLALFGLKPPSSFQEVKTARNREMLKYHPDKFANDPEKLKVANDIALIYNAAFDRLKQHFGA